MSLSDYQELETIGKGSFGKVKKVKRINDGKIFVWKEVDYLKMKSNKQKQQLITEVNVLQELNHDNIVKYEDKIVDKKNSKIYIVMQYCSEGDMSHFLKDYKNNKHYIPQDVIWRLFFQIVMALDYCHYKKIIHRDIKPANIFIHEDKGERYIKLGDFGLSRQLGQYSQFAQTNVGTPYYMSPEQVKQTNYNQKSDIWSAGIILYEMASLRRPFQATNHLALAQKINIGKFQRIPMRYSQNLSGLISKMLNINPQKRLSAKQILQYPLFAIRLKQRQIKKREQLCVKKYSQLKKEKEQLKNQKRKIMQEMGSMFSSQDSCSSNQVKRKKSLYQTDLDYEQKQNLQNYSNLIFQRNSSKNSQKYQ